MSRTTNAMITSQAVLALVLVGAGSLPATAQTDEAPTTTTDAFVTESVEPSVDIILSDGAGNDFSDTRRSGPHLERLAIGPDGTVWVAGWVEGRQGGFRVWALGQPESFGVEDGTPEWIVSLSFDPDGTLWAVGSSIARFDGERWVPATDSPARFATPDGTLWFIHPRRGIEAWDGTTSTRYLKDKHISEISLAPDGTVWAVGRGDEGAAIYRITPEENS